MSKVVICRDCDTVHRAVTLRPGDVALCQRCTAILGRFYGVDADRELALVIAALICFAMCNLCPLLTIQVAGVETEATVWRAVLSMQQGWIWVAAIGLAITTFLIPATQLTLLLWVLIFARAGRRPPLYRPLMRVLYHIRPWSMTEVFLLGALVAIVKLANWVPISAGIGIGAMAALTVLMAMLGRCDPASWWSIGFGSKS